MEDYIFQVEVPTEEVTEIKNGQRKLVKRNKCAPATSWCAWTDRRVVGRVRHTPGVTGFVGNSHQPAPLSEDEVVSILAAAGAKKAAGDLRAPPRPPRARLRRPEPSRSTSSSATRSPWYRWPVRDAARHDQRDQHRGPEAHGPGGDLRPRDTRSNWLQPDREELSYDRPRIAGTGKKEGPEMPPKKKKVAGLIKLQIQAGQANPAPPVGPALGQHGVNIMEFCKAYNAATESQRGNVIPVEITVYEDRSFTSSPRPRRPPS
jgi:hypothetical protein